MTLTDGIDGFTAFVATVAAVLIWTIGAKHTPRLVVGLVLTASIGFLSTRMGSWITDGIGWSMGWMNDIARYIVGATVFGLPAFVVAYIVFYDVGTAKYIATKIFHGPSAGGWDGGSSGFVGRVLGEPQVSNRTLVCAAALPFLAVNLPGFGGEAVWWVMDAWSSIIAWLIHLLFH